MNELLETSVPGVFAAGNALVINDLVDYAVEQGELAAEGARYFIENDGTPATGWKRVVGGRNTRFVVPHYISCRRDVVLYSRVQRSERNVVATIPEVGWRMRQINVRPAEMIRVRLTRELLEKCTSAEKISMEVVPSG